jgi:hypothetical protein
MAGVTGLLEELDGARLVFRNTRPSGVHHAQVGTASCSASIAGPRGGARSTSAGPSRRPSSFFDAGERHVLAGPFRDRWSRRRARDPVEMPIPAGAATPASLSLPEAVRVHGRPAAPLAAPTSTACVSARPPSLFVPAPLRIAIADAWVAWARRADSS